MAHEAQQAFCREVKERFPEFFVNTRVLEIGSRNINGTIRDEFQDCRYVGVDCDAGDGVDVVCFGHEYEDEAGSFDVVCSVETFEHDPHAACTVSNMVRLLRSGGLFFMTCASDGRDEHGTRRSGKKYGPDPSFYRNVSVREFLKWIQADSVRFREFHVRQNLEAFDLYFFGIKA